MKEKKDEIWEDVKKSLEELRERVVNLAKKGKKESIVAYRIGKIKLEIVGIRYKIDDRLKEIGEKVNELYKKNKIENIELQDLCKEVAVLDDIIKSKEKEIEIIAGHR